MLVGIGSVGAPLHRSAINIRIIPYDKTLPVIAGGGNGLRRLDFPRDAQSQYSGMDNSKFSEALVASLLALATSSAVHARSPEPWHQPADDPASGSGVVTSRARNSVSFGPLADGGNVFGEFRRSTSPFGGTASPANGVQAPSRLGSIDAKKIQGRHEFDASSASTVPELSTYLLLVLGLVGIALVSHRRQPNE